MYAIDLIPVTIQYQLKSLRIPKKREFFGWMARVLCRGGGGEDIQAHRDSGGPRHGARTLSLELNLSLQASTHVKELMNTCVEKSGHVMYI